MRYPDRNRSRILPPAITPAARAGEIPADSLPYESKVLPPDLPPAIPLDRIRSVQDSVLVRRGDQLTITSYSSVASILVQIITRIYVNGDIQVGLQTFTTNGTRAAQATTIDLTDGLLIGVQILVLSGTALRGTVFIKGVIFQGSGTTQTQLGIISNYVTTNNQISYPTSPLINSTDGDGFLNPVDTSGGTVFIPVNTLWKVIAVNAAIHCSAVAANRNYEFDQNLPGPSTATQSIPRRLQVANENIFYHLGDYSESTALFTDALGTVHWYVQMPQLKIRRGGFVTSTIINIQAGDTNTSFVVVEEWMDI
jgi:hypothetical protein